MRKRQLYLDFCSYQAKQNGLEEDPHFSQSLSHGIVLVIDPSLFSPTDACHKCHNQDCQGTRTGKLDHLRSKKGQQTSAKEEDEPEAVEVGRIFGREEYY